MVMTLQGTFCFSHMSSWDSNKRYVVQVQYEFVVESDHLRPSSLVVSVLHIEQLSSDAAIRQAYYSYTDMQLFVA
jgi:hypothetical protein